VVSHRERPLTAPRRRAIAVFLAVATLVWWFAHQDGTFYIAGMSSPASELLGPLLPAVSAGLAAALVFSVVDAGAGSWAAGVAVVMLLALPGFLPLHRASLNGPPLEVGVMLTLAVMLYAPRFSLAYGAIAAATAVFVSPAGLGLPLAAMAWAIMTRRGVSRAWRRILLSLSPVVLAVLVGRWLGHAWPADELVLGWRGHLDDGLRAAGRVIGDQLAPSLSNPALRWFAIADLTLVMVAVIVVAWRRVRRLGAFDAIIARFHPAIAVTAAGLAVGLALRWLLIPGSPALDLDAVFPLVVLALVATVGSVGQLWSRWPRWGKVLCGLVLLGWLQAALRA
jgi:hypothetical protein